MWLRAVGLHMTTPYRGFMVLDAGEPAPEIPGSFVYEPFTPRQSASMSGRTDSSPSS